MKTKQWLQWRRDDAMSPDQCCCSRSEAYWPPFNVIDHCNPKEMSPNRWCHPRREGGAACQPRQPFNVIDHCKYCFSFPLLPLFQSPLCSSPPINSHLFSLPLFYLSSHILSFLFLPSSPISSPLLPSSYLISFLRLHDVEYMLFLLE